MAKIRGVKAASVSRPTIEGAGVHLMRAFGFNEVGRMDPFLLLDDFRSQTPEHYLKGFPWHPHRGIETITYVLEGRVEHGDSLGNTGIIGPGDVQWMTAGGGIVHQEMPQGGDRGRMGGFQLWANLPARYKMMAPRYRDVTADSIPEAELAGGVRVKIICGQVEGVSGPVSDTVTEPMYLDFSLPAGAELEFPVPPGNTVLAYVIAGDGAFGAGFDTGVGNRSLVVFDEGEAVAARAGEEGLRFLLMSGRPIGEPIAWGGPIVMNTQEELDLAFEEYREGTFLKHD